MQTQLILILLLLTILQTSISQPEEQLDFTGARCRGESIVTTTTYHSNILTLLSEVITLSSTEKFSTLSVGLGTDRVNGLYLCRPDLSLSTCNACIEATMTIFNRHCYDKKEAIIWYEECMIQYTNRSVSADVNIQPLYYNYGMFQVSEPEAFPELRNTTMMTLISEATTNDTPPFYAFGERKFTLFEGFFGMVLCRPDITAEECEECLTFALSIIPSCCSEGLAQWTMIFQPSCQLRYDTVPFITPRPPRLVA